MKTVGEYMGKRSLFSWYREQRMFVKAAGKTGQEITESKELRVRLREGL